MTDVYQHLGAFSDLVAAKRSHPVWPAAQLGHATQERVRDVLAVLSS